MSNELVYATDTKGYWRADGPNGLNATKRLGDTGEPSGSVSFTNGTGSGQCNVMYRRESSVAAAATFTLDLKGGNGELDILNNALSMVKVRYIRLVIPTPTTALAVRLGPQNIANGMVGPFSVATANGYVTVTDKFEAVNSVDGWAVGASTKTISINNPSAAAVSYVLEILGTDA